MNYHQPYTMNGNRSAKVKGFMGLPRSLNVVMRAQLQNVQVFKTEKAAAEKYFNALLRGEYEN